MRKLKFYMWLPIFALLVFSSISIAQDIDREELKAEIIQAVITALKSETTNDAQQRALKAEIMQEVEALLKNETKAEVQEATLGLREMLRSDFKSDIKAELMEGTDDLSLQMEEILEHSTILGGLFKGVSVGGFMDINFLYNLRLHGDSPTRDNASAAGVNFVGERSNDTFALENFALFLDKEVTDEDPIGWQFHTYMGEKAKTLTWSGENDTASNLVTSDTARNDIFTIATANISWNAPVFGKHVKFTVGKMYAWMGYELTENISNPNYTHGMANNQFMPFTNMGFSADVSEFLPSDKWGLSFYCVNGWDSFIDNNKSKTYGSYLTYTPNHDLFISLATIYGKEGQGFRRGVAIREDGSGATDDSNGNTTFLYDIVIHYTLPQVEKLSLGFEWLHGFLENGVGHSDGSLGGGITTGMSMLNWWGAVGYAMWDFTDTQQGAFRYEYVDDTEGLWFGHSMWSLTYTQNITIRDHVMIRPEIRYNKFNLPSGEEINFIDNGVDKSITDDSEFIVGAGVEYIF